MKLTRNIKIFINYVLGPLLFLWLSYSLYSQVKKQPDLPQAWEQIRNIPVNKVIWSVSAVFILMLVNWFIETWKWKLAIQKVQRIHLFTAFKAVLSGISFSVTTPNRVGEYAGRILYLDEGNRLRSISLTIMCSMSQLMITLLMGCIGLAVMMNKLADTGLNNSIWLKLILYGSIAACIVTAIIYFRLSLLTKLAEKIPWLNRNLYLVKEVEDAGLKLLVKLLLLSATRFIVFCIQYYLLFNLFGVDISWWQCFWVLCVAFLILAVIPGFAIAELGIKGEVIWRLIQLFTVNALGVTLTIAGIWFINLILPAIAGSILIVGVKLFKNKKETG
jgi:hypothetical protein